MISANRRVIDTAEKNRLFIEVYVFHEMTYIFAPEVLRLPLGAVGL